MNCAREARVHSAHPPQIAAGTEWSRLWVACVTTVAVAGLTCLFVWNPAQSTFYPPCLFHALTGLHCPGCGTLRAMHALAHGRLVEALGLNALSTLAAPLVVCHAARSALAAARHRPLPRLVLSAATIRAFLVLVLLFALLRNLPVYPFSLLAP